MDGDAYKAIGIYGKAECPQEVNKDSRKINCFEIAWARMPVISRAPLHQ